MNNKVIQIFLIVLLFSCGEDPNNGAKNDITFSKEIQEVINVAKQFQTNTINSTLVINYESGEPWIRFKRTNGLLDSTFVEEYKSGNLKTLINFDNGELAFGEHSTHYDTLLTYFIQNKNDTLAIESPMIRTYYFSNRDKKIVYKREYNTQGDPTYTEGELIYFAKGGIDKDSVILQYYLVPLPYQNRYYDLNRKFYVSYSISDSVIKKEIPINEEYSAAFYKTSIDNMKILKFTGTAIYTDLIYGDEMIADNFAMQDSKTIIIK